MIGIIAAMDKEVAGWLELVAVREIVTIADKTFYLSSYEGDELVIAQSGIGKVNAAITAALLLSRFPIDYVVNTGVAGGVLPAQTGDLVVGDRILYADVDLTKIDPIPYGQMAGEALYALADPVLLGRAEAALVSLGYSYRIGAIASADRFTTDKSDLAAVLSHTPDIVACDMESMAVAMAAVKF
ncbi:MAG: 5'-methylthioadenosine/S-adenosylhomocysteine nucleosidase, partial [Bacillota bacterium]|nr:5'-methylthioadenosine/S-adenosylhomocysteine nucleosidase [Bacillota bacterium]